MIAEDVKDVEGKFMPEEKTIWKDTGKMLNIAHMALLLITLTYVFAYLQKDVERINEKLEIQTEQIKVLKEHNRITYVRRDVFNEQYRQIIERLDKLNKKLSTED